MPVFLLRSIVIIKQNFYLFVVYNYRQSVANVKPFSPVIAVIVQIHELLKTVISKLNSISALISIFILLLFCLALEKIYCIFTDK